jgi:lipopolysaccharide/colanic/teichoic acid biosynthesis glycosyltransferase
MLLLDLSAPSARPNLQYRVVKRGLDLLLAGVAVIVLAPVMIAIAVSLKLEDRAAPIFFRQPRTGLGGRRFSVLKFRTMVRNAEELKEQLRHLSEVPYPDFRLTNDPRVTRTGRLLRRTSLDELPQFFNVLLGDMSLVGPRPTSFDASTYEMWHSGRLEFRPGITGPWQVWGRTTMDFEQRCRLEIGFFRNPSILREIGLLFATVKSVLRRTGVA